MNTRITKAIDALIAGNSEEALGHLLMLQVEQIEKAPPVKIDVPNDAERVYADELPPIQHTRRRGWSSLDVKCPTCKAKVGQRCFAMTKRGLHGEPTTEHVDKLHTPRREKAKAGKS